MKLRDRLVIGFCLSLVLVTVLFVIDLQNEHSRRLAATVGRDDDADGGYYDDGAGGDVGLHGRYNGSRAAGHAQSAWNFVSSFVGVTGMPPKAGDRTDKQPRPNAAPSLYPYTSVVDNYPPVADPYADDRFHDLVELLSQPLPHRGPTINWSMVRDVIVDDSNDDGITSNEYIVEHLEEGLR